MHGRAAQTSTSRLGRAPNAKPDRQSPVDSSSSSYEPTSDPSAGANQELSTASQTAPGSADARIDHSAALRYWSSISADDAGVLGGYPSVSRADLRGSAAFVARLQRRNPRYGRGQRLSRVVDCGAGIGRVTRGLLAKVALVVDLVEPVRSLTDVVTVGEAFAELRDAGTIGEVYNVGLEDWVPCETYALVWNQWCVGQLTDRQLVEYLRRIQRYLESGGWIVVKENVSTHPLGSDVFDETDNSVTRTDQSFRALFREAGLEVVASELQKGMPKGLYPVRSYALQPEKGRKEEVNREKEEMQR